MRNSVLLRSNSGGLTGDPGSLTAMMPCGQAMGRKVKYKSTSSHNKIYRGLNPSHIIIYLNN
jgi:hypothetical protein